MGTQEIEKLEAEIKNATQALEKLKIGISENDGGLEDYAREELEKVLRHALEIVVKPKA